MLLRRVSGAVGKYRRQESLPSQEEKKGDLSYVFNRKTARNVLMHKKGREMWQEMSLETSDGERTRAKPWT